MKSHSAVAHDWAHGRAATGNSMYSLPRDNNHCVVFSYGDHFMAGCAWGWDKAETHGVALINSNTGRSSSTGRHLRLATQAVKHYGKVFHVDNPKVGKYDAKIYHGVTLTDEEKRYRKTGHVRNYEGLVALATEYLEDALGRRPGSNIQASSMRQAARYTEEANDYTKFFKLGYRQRDVPELSEELILLNKEAKRKQLAREKLNVRKWLSGESDHLVRTSKPYFRLVDKTHEIRDNPKYPTYQPDIHWTIETSWGVRGIPYILVRRWLPLAERCAAHSVAASTHEVDELNRTIRDEAKNLGLSYTWQLSGVNAQGSIRSGCHAISLREAKKLRELAT